MITPCAECGVSIWRASHGSIPKGVKQHYGQGLCRACKRAKDHCVETRLSLEEMIEEYNWLKSYGMLDEMIARQLKMTPKSLERALYRWKVRNAGPRQEQMSGNSLAQA